VGKVVHLGSAVSLREKAIFGADDLCVKVGGELGMVVCEVFDGEISAERRTGKVDVHDGYRHIV
jgi:hypothetical protein